MRGGDLDPRILRDDAERCHAVYGIYGISVFAARDLTVDELAQQPPLIRFEVLTLVRVGDLVASGFALEPTGRNPSHFTVVFDDLDAGVEQVCNCSHRTWVNPYHEE